MALNSLLNIGSSALAATQTAINVTGGNIANVNTDGYCRQAARFEELQPLDFHAGQLGQGVKANEIMRYFNRFVENSYLDKSADFNRWSEQSTILSSVESLFNESNRKGISSAMGAFFNDWQDLSLRPNDMATREALMANANTLTNLIRDTKASLESAQREMDMYIRQGVREVNDLIDSIQEVNKHISAQDVPGVSNANGLKDERDRMVRELAELVDIKVEDKGGSNFTIRTKNGSVLLDANTKFTLTTESERIENNLIKGSAYKGTLEVVGNDSNEYTFQVESSPTAGGPGQMKVSLDGGRTWLKNEDGTALMVDVPATAGQKIRVKDLEVSFTADPTQLSAGDRFEVIPKEGLYWVSPTRPPLNVTPQTMSDGTDNTNRLTGGKIAAYYNVRDQNVGRYMDKLDALSKSLIWEVNNIHAQGSGTTTMAHILGTYKVERQDLPLGVSGSGLPYSDRLTQGNLSIQIYDKEGKPMVLPPPQQNPPPLDFDTLTPGVQNFDPAVHTIDDVVAAINSTYRDPATTNQLLTASVIDGKLQLTAGAGTSFTVANDTTGLMAGLGINTFFKGSSASDLALNDTVSQNTGYINAGKLNASGEVNSGDPSTAKALAELATKSVKISTGWETSTTQSLGEYYGTLVGTVGSETRSANTTAAYNKALATDLDERASAISGVNLDEEMTSLIKFQHSYTAAAKLITTADQMMQTLLGLKQ